MSDTMNTPHDPELVARAGLQSFFAICQRWQLDDTQMQQLLGNPAQDRFGYWVEHQADTALDEDVLLRISAILGIYKALHLLLPPSAADDWVKRSNSDPLFQGQTALAKMMSGDRDDVLAVRHYLDAQCV